ncbi:ribonuclease III [Kordiimonas pumila]|uniref:Ribonuclease 3 n=1 Tax=Kordiimonas pumila TaxID=2161677 RepID=A0ABV7D1S2_9PROT|nr:ribonuclease III [Kordiimonas pumila]
MTELKELAGYRFAKTSLLDEALTHPSLSGSYNYQRLEFLGDRVLGLTISTWLLEAYPSEAEGLLNRRFTSLVRRETLAGMAVKLGIAAALKVTPGAETEGARDKEAIQADVCEAFIGAMYLDGGFAVTDKFIRQHWIPLMDTELDAVKDHKTKLQEWCQARSLDLPHYSVLDRTGPDHDPVFTIEATIDGKGSASAQGGTKKTAEQDAAAALLRHLLGETG